MRWPVGEILTAGLVWGPWSTSRAFRTAMVKWRPVAPDSSGQREELRALVSAFGEELPLDHALLLIARDEYPEVDARRYLSRLDDLADRVLHVLSGGTQLDLQRAISSTLFQVEGFRGNGRDYYDPKNSFLHQVIDRRLGIPITLSIVYLEVARRLGATAFGVGFPGHFLVSHQIEGSSVLLDPFSGGAVVDRAGCKRILASVIGGAIEVETWMLAPTSAKSIVLRVLTNLKHAYILRKDYMSALSTLDRLLVIDASRWSDLRDRGLLFMALDCSAFAAADLEMYLEHAEPGRDVDLIKRILPNLKKTTKSLN